MITEVCKVDLYGAKLGNDCTYCGHLVAIHSHSEGCGMCAMIMDLREWVDNANQAISQGRRINYYGEPPAG